MLIETAVSFPLAVIGLVINKALYQNRNEFLQKHALKILSFSIHSMVVTFMLAILGYYSFAGLVALKTHVFRAFIDHGVHLGSAASVQLTLGKDMDMDAGRDGSLARLRAINLFKDSHPNLMNDLLAQRERDLGTSLSNTQNAVADALQVQEYFEKNTNDQQFIHTFEWRRFLDDQTYRTQGIAIARRLLIAMRMVLPIQGGQVAREVELSRHTPDELAYRNWLTWFFKQNLLQLHGEQEQWQHLNRNGTNGNQLLKSMDLSIYIPLVRDTTLAEVMIEQTPCPAQFTGNLAVYNDRREKIIEARACIGRLNNAQKEALRRKILNEADEQADAGVQEAFLKISDLARFLIEGPLITTTTFNLEVIDNDHDFIGKLDLLQVAWREAIATIEGADEAVPH